MSAFRRPLGNRRARLVVASCAAVCLVAASSDRAGRRSTDPGGLPGNHAGMSFARIEYDSSGGMNEAYYYYEGRYWNRWETDFPQADQNFLYRFAELTTAHPYPLPVTRRLADPDLFDFPLIYMCDVGWMVLDELETQRLRDYLLKGGFLWIDDFWGSAEWNNIERVFREVFPSRSFQEIAPGHEIYNMVYELDALPQVPARDFAWLGHDPPEIHRYPAERVTPANFRGLYDDDGRLMAVATHNTDIGDGWEREAYGEWYFETYSTVAYATGVNIVVYALSH